VCVYDKINLTAAGYKQDTKQVVYTARFAMSHATFSERFCHFKHVINKKPSNHENHKPVPCLI
jgi:hypothetical protein